VRDDAVGRTAIADAPRHLPCVDTANARQVVRLQPGIEVARRAPVGRIGDVLAQHDAGAPQG